MTMGSTKGAVFDVNAPTWYQVVADGVQSPIHTLQVVDVPYVQRLEIEYHYPAYTGLEPQKIEDGGDIAVLRGTDVRLRIFPTMKTPGGRITLNEKDAIELAPQADGSLTASFKADRDGSYRVELKAPSGEFVVGVAAVHDRCARRSGAVGVLQSARAAIRRCRRSKKCSSRPRPKTISAFATSSSCTR